MRYAASRRSPLPRRGGLPRRPQGGSTDTSIDTSQLIGLAVPIVETRCCPKACGFSDWYPALGAQGGRDLTPDPANPMYGSGSGRTVVDGVAVEGWPWTYGPGRHLKPLGLFLTAF